MPVLCPHCGAEFAPETPREFLASRLPYGTSVEEAFPEDRPPQIGLVMACGSCEQGFEVRDIWPDDGGSVAAVSR